MDTPSFPIQVPPQEIELSKSPSQAYAEALAAKERLKLAEKNIDQHNEILDQIKTQLSTSNHKKERIQKQFDNLQAETARLENELLLANQNMKSAFMNLCAEQQEALDGEENFSDYESSDCSSEDELDTQEHTYFHGINMPAGINVVENVPNTQLYINRSSIEPTLNADDFKTDKLMLLSGDGRGIKYLSGKQPSYTCIFPDKTKQTLRLSSELKVNTHQTGMDRVGIVSINEGNKTLLIAGIPFPGGLHHNGNAKSKNKSASSTTINIEPYPVKNKLR